MDVYAFRHQFFKLGGQERDKVSVIDVSFSDMAKKNVTEVLFLYFVT